jgi:hypothetical protein
MPKKSPDKRAYTPPVFRGFIDLPLTDAQLDAQKRWDVSDDALLDGLLKFTEEGYAVKFRWDSYNECHQATATPVDSAHSYAGWYLTGRGSAPIKALKQLLWLHYHVLDALWPVDNPVPKRKDKFE